MTGIFDQLASLSEDKNPDEALPTADKHSNDTNATEDSSLPNTAAQYTLSSDELADEVETQYGLGATWRPYRFISFSLEYFSGQYKNRFVFDDNDNALTKRQTIYSRLTMEF